MQCELRTGRRSKQEKAVPPMIYQLIHFTNKTGKSPHHSNAARALRMTEPSIFRVDQLESEL